MTKRYQFTLSDAQAKILDEKMHKHGFNTIGEAVRKAFKLEEARSLPWLKGRVCQPGAADTGEPRDTQPTPEHEDDAAQ